MRLVFNNMQDYVDNIIKGAAYKIEYIDEKTDEELLEEVKIINTDNTSITVKNQNEYIKIIDTLWIKKYCLFK